MTESYPNLTVSNINYWYWGLEPHWLVPDIAKSIGCSHGIVYSFMRKNNVPIRSRSKANLNRFKYPHKHDKYIKQRQSEEFRASQSLIAYDVMYRPEVRKRYLQAIKKSNGGKLSKYQKLILHLLSIHGDLFITQLLGLIKGSLKTVDNSLRGLFNRQFVDRVKALNPKSFNKYKFHYKYSITKKGEALISRKLKEGNCKFEELLQDLVSQEKEKDKETLQQEFIKRENIGKNQLVILKTIQKSGSKFLRDLVSILGLQKRTIDSSLRCLSSRGFLDREKKENLMYH